MSLKKLIQDYLKSPNTIQRNSWINYTVTQPTLGERIEVAIKSRDDKGILNNHQNVLGEKNLVGFYNEMSSPKNLSEIETYTKNKDFDGLYRFFLNATDSYRIANLAAYDMSLRIAHAFKFRPKFIYIHVGVKDGAKALGIFNYIKLDGKDYITREELLKYYPDFEPLQSDDIESFLSIYHRRNKSELEEIGSTMRKRFEKKNKYSKDNPYG